MTPCACGSLSLRSRHVLLTHTCRAQAHGVSALTRTSPLRLIKAQHTVLGVGALVHLEDTQECPCAYRNTHIRSCTYTRFLTCTSPAPSVALYGQSDQYSTCFIASPLANIPALSSCFPSIGDTNQWAGGPRLLFLSTNQNVPPHSPQLLQLWFIQTKFSTSLVRTTSLEAL